MTQEVPDILKQIIEYKAQEVAKLKANTSFSDLVKNAKSAPQLRGFHKALKSKTNEFALIAEIKKASPSKGLIREDFNPVQHAIDYEKGGAACLSILTDAPSFGGSDDFLIEARKACTLPCLRKDFMIDPIQIIESRALGADAILIIMAALDDAHAKELFETANEFGIDSLIETHDEEEIERALKLGGNLIGINNRSLRSFETNLETTERLSKLLPQNIDLVCESGLYTNADLCRMAKSGAFAFLVGESLMRQDDIVKATRELLGAQKA